MEKLIITSSPHIHAKDTTRSIMRDVLIALAPAAVASVVLFGLRALLIIVTCVATAVLSELLFNLICRKKQTVSDLSAAVTGMILALSLPAKTELWQCALGAVLAIVVVKCLFGGIGCNFANPAVTARVFMLLAFTAAGGGSATKFMTAELAASATPLAAIKKAVEDTAKAVAEAAEAGLAADTVETVEPLLPSLMDMLVGNRGGAIGETCILALCLGGIYLIARRVISWKVPATYIATVFVLSLIIKQDVTAALYQVLGGGVFIAAFFMITDYVTTPVNKWGKILFAFGCGVITVLIRIWGSYPEGVSFAILLMNIVSPYIEKLCTAKPLGKVGK